MKTFRLLIFHFRNLRGKLERVLIRFFNDISYDLSHIKNIFYAILNQNGSLSMLAVNSPLYNRVSLTLNGNIKKTVGLSVVKKKRFYGEEWKFRRTFPLEYLVLPSRRFWKQLTCVNEVVANRCEKGYAFCKL